MVVQRKRFRIEEVVFGSAPPIDQPDTEIIPMHDEIMTELRAIRDQKLALPLDASLEQARPHRAEFWRSGRAP